VNQIYHLAKISILNPEEATSILFSKGWNVTIAAMVLTAATCISTILAFIPNPDISEEIRANGLMFSPIGTAVIVLMSSYLAAFFISRGGTWFGGKATFGQILSIMAWTQVLQVIFQTIVVMILFIVAPIAGIMQIGFVILGVYILISFVKAAHGLQSLLVSGILVIFGSLFAFLGTGLIFGGIINRFLS